MRASSLCRRFVCVLFVLALAGCGGVSETVDGGGDQHDGSPETVAADAASDLGSKVDQVDDAAPERVGDATPPSVQFVQPVQGAEVEGIVEVEVDAQDDTGVVKVELSVGGEPVGMDEEAPYEFQWDTTDLGPGTYTLKAVAQDAVGNEGEATISVTIVGECDASGDCPPSVSFQQPGPDAYVRGVVELKASASDDDAVVKVRFLVDEGLLVEDAQVPYKASWETAEFDDGAHVLELIAYDTTNKSASAEIQVTVDNTPPELSLVSPEEMAIQHDVILLAAEAADNIQMDRVEFSMDGMELEPVSEEPWELVYDGSSLASGLHVVKATALDAAGNETSVTREILVDRPPVVGILTPEAGATVTGPFSVQAEVMDDVGLDSVILYMDGDAWMAALDPVGNGLYEDTCFPPYEKAERTLTVVATDSEGQESEATVMVLVDHPVSVDLKVCEDAACEALEPDSELTGIVQLRAVAEDDGAEIVGVDFLVDGELVAQGLETPFDFSWDTTGVTDGARTLGAVASNTLDETGEVQVKVQVNNCDLDHDNSIAAGCGGPDCDDEDPGVNPAQPDLVGDGTDENCDGMDGTDGDGDGYASESTGGEDCDDTEPLIHPCAEDLPDDGLDANCDAEDALSCDDCLPCTADGLVAGACVHAPVPDGGGCDDGEPCTDPGTCQDMVCLAGLPTDCDDTNPCTADGCLPASGCYHLSMDGLPCDGGVCFDSACCIPDCVDVECGGDGCGGSCGVCGEGSTCEGGLCVLPGLTCMEYDNCMFQCDQDPACIAACEAESNPLSVMQWDTMMQCLQDNGVGACETEECVVAILYEDCLEPWVACIQPDCSSLYYWLAYCQDDEACKAMVLDAAAPGAVQTYNAFEGCLKEHYYYDCETDACELFILEQFCIQSYSTCFSGDLTCPEIYACRADCESGDSACKASCFFEGTSQAQDQYNNLTGCMWDYCDEDSPPECWDAAWEGPCQPLVEACETGQCTLSCGGASCGSDGCGGFCGQCGAGEVCVNGGCVPCDPDCVDKDCGPDGCGGTCGQCVGDASACEGGVCIDPESCDCPPWQLCTLDGCVDPPSMGEAEYGGEYVAIGCYGMTWLGCCAGTVLYYCDDQSGGCPGGAEVCLVKLECGPGATCGWGDQFFMCVDPPPEPDPGGDLSCDWFTCDLDCEGKLCGPDGCGGICGACDVGEACFEGACFDGPGCAVTPELPGCGGCACEACVCDLDPYCCETEWDEICVQECLGDCGGCGACVPICDGPPCSPDGCGGFCVGPCDDEDLCTVDDLCTSAGLCVGTLIECSDGNACTGDACDPEIGACVFFALPEGIPCGPGAICADGECVVLCQDECTAGEVGCDDQTPWSCIVPPGGICTIKVVDDPCLEGEVCAAGECCTSACNGSLCGDDGCGGSCGSCCPLELNSYGLCDMMLGIIFDGESCVYISGCSCGPDCEYFFDTIQECEAACGI
ncbi:MAG: Ig-like domain-containing protein [Pseudomonadota bacterium]